MLFNSRNNSRIITIMLTRWGQSLKHPCFFITRNYATHVNNVRYSNTRKGVNLQ